MNRKINLNDEFYEIINKINTLIKRIDIIYQKYYIFDSNSY